MASPVEAPLADGTQGCGLERALRIIEGLDAAASREFSRVTRLVIGDDWRSAAVPGRLLNPSGAPLEFSFARGSQDLRYTMEVGGADTAPAQHLARIEDVLAALDPDGNLDGVARALSAMQRGHRLDWGAWLGARQSLQQANAPATRYKVYAEVPAGSNAIVSSWLDRYLGTPSLGVGPGTLLVMVGAAPVSQRREFYYEFGSRSFTRRCLSVLLQRVRLGHRLDDLFAAIGSFEFRHGREPDALPSAQYGFSYSVLPGGLEPVFCVFIFAADLAGGDAWIRRRLLEACEGDSALGIYAAMTEPLAGRYFSTFSHNMVTFSVGADTPVAWQVSLSPPPDVRKND